MKTREADLPVRGILVTSGHKIIPSDFNESNMTGLAVNTMVGKEAHSVSRSERDFML